MAARVRFAQLAQTVVSGDPFRCGKDVLALIAGLSSESPKRFHVGGRRSIAPEETLATLSSLMPKLGITRIANVTGLDRIGIPVISVCRPNSRSLAVYQGKGATVTAAKVSGLMESIERYHAEFIPPPTQFASYAAMREAAPVVESDELAVRNERHFREDMKRGWVQGLDVLNKSAIWVPHEIVHFATAEHFSPDHYFASASTGLAAGNTLSEAILHGICEIIERDGSTLWRLRLPQTQNRSRIDLATIDDPLCKDLIAQIERAGAHVAVWNTTNEVRVASFICRIAESEGADPTPYELLDAAGCHPARGVALARAILEAAQGRATMISGARDDLFHNYYEANDAELAKKLRESVISDPCPASFQDVPTFDGPTIEADLEHVLACLTKAGFDRVVAVNLMRDEIGVPVVRTIIPALEDGELADYYVPRARAMRAYRGY